MKKSILVIALVASFLGQAAQAEIRNPFNLKEVYDETTFKGDLTLSNTWLNGVAGHRKDDVYTGSLDYRMEAATNLYKLGGHTGTLVTRVEGLAFFDEQIDDFFSDRLIDIPELFLVDSFDINDSTAGAIVFGKFAHRRFIDKNEIINDPFDIGERAYFGQATGHSNLLALVNEGREGDSDNRYLSKMATGSYGFAVAIADKEGDTFWDRWGIKQAFVVARMDDFGDNYYQATDITKNWGDSENPGQFDIGYVYAQNKVLYRVDGTDDTNVFFTTLAQRFGKFAAYGRYGVAFAGLAPGDNTTINNLALGIQYDLTDKNTWGFDYLTLNSNNSAVFDSSSLYTTYITHKFNDHLKANGYLGFGSGAPNATSFGSGDDHNWMIGFNFQGIL